MKYFKTANIIIFSVLLLQACSDSDIKLKEPPVAVITTIVDAAVSNGNFTTLVAGLQATGLNVTLADTTTKFTVFAPTDEAYAANGTMLTTASGTKVSARVDAETSMLIIGGAKVIIKDIYATNGVVHVIDTVILE